MTRSLSLNKMVLLTSILSALLTATIVSAETTQDPYRAQYERSIEGVLANFLDNGALVASPSRAQPDYYYDWVRDTSLTMKPVVELSKDLTISTDLRRKLVARIDVWINFELARQQTQTLTGLGEPKFYVSGKANLEPWGRPQNDGPALRALTAIEIANQMIQQGRFDEVTARLYRGELPANTLIKRDLEYVAHHWQETSFDLWEEERAMHFYTLTAQKVALAKGAKLAQTLGDFEASRFYQQQASAIDGYLKSFVDQKSGIVRYALNKSPGLAHKQSDLDVAVLLAAIQTFDGQFYVPVIEVTNTVNQLTKAFEAIYTVNKTRVSKGGLALGVALGRYPDDKYSGFDFSTGNPWFLATAAVAEFACDLAKSQKFTPQQRKALSETAIQQFNRILFHRDANGSLSEQFNRENGYMQGARDLTWSYASYITAYRACYR